MKSNLKKKTDNEIILSIGMIVKNEEKHLDNCLSALQKLRDNVSNELIIVDTGSTDKTKEIAFKYTDKVYDFEWIDDFSAARNFGLKKAKGKWFMFLDADEYMDEDCSEMVKFFNMPELYEKYNTASYIIRNYDSMTRKSATDFLGSRLVKLLPGVEFGGKIHEQLPYILPHGYFGTVFHHYGYINNDPYYLKKKLERNLPLILEHYKESPDDLFVIGQLIDGSKESMDKIKYVEEGFKFIDLPKNECAVNAFLIRAMRAYVRVKKYEKALEVCDKFFAIDGNKNVVSVLSIYVGMASIHMAQDDYKQAVEDFEHYFEAYHDYKAGKLDVFDLRMNVIEGCCEYEYEQYRLYYIDCLCKLKRFEEAHKCMQEIDLTDMQIPELRAYLSSYRSLFRQSKNYADAAKVYGEILSLNDEDKTGLVLFMLEEYYKEYEFERTEFINGMIDSGVEGPYIELMKLVRDSNDGIDISERLAEFIHSVNSWKDGYSEAIYLAMKHNVDLNGAIAGMSHDILKSHFPIIAEGHSDYALTAMKYCENIDFTGSIKSMLWMVSALETAVLTSQKLLAEERRELYDLFLCTLSDYVLNIYNPELLNPEDADVLPKLHRFGYYMTLAFTAKNNNDDIAYIRTLKEALRLCEPMKDLVSFYLSEFEEELRSKN